MKEPRSAGRRIVAPRCEVASDGTLTLGDSRVTVPNYFFLQELGRGASAIVFLARHKYLPREAAIKIWMTLNPDDLRDKFKQGIEEARKAQRASEADQAVKAITIYDAGEASGHFFMAMEHFLSVTLRQWLRGTKLIQYGEDGKVITKRVCNDRPSLGLRWNMAKQLVDSSLAAAQANIIHGDLHSNNVLVGPVRCEFLPDDFRIIDYGTSLFRGRKFSLDRHWDVLDATLSELLQPFKMDQWCEEFVRFRRAKRPNAPNLLFMHMQYGAFLARVNYMVGLITTSNQKAPQRANWSPEDEIRYRHLFDQLLESGRLKADFDYLGRSYDWNPGEY